MFQENQTAEYILASVGAGLWIVTIIPQIIKSYRTKSTAGLSPWLMAAKRAIVTLISILLVAGAFETTSIFALWYGQMKGTEVPLLFYGYLSTALTIIGFVPQFYEIYRLRQVTGISLIFLGMDVTGGTTSALALFFRKELDIVALITYLGVVSLDLAIIILYFVLGHEKPAPPAFNRNLDENELQPVTPITADHKSDMYASTATLTAPVSLRKYDC